MKETMKKRFCLPSLILLVVLPVGPANGQEAVPSTSLQPPKAESPDHYSVGLRLGFNIKADFKTGFGPGQPIPAPGIHRVDRTYDDGFNKVDVTGNAGGYTAYWNYQYNSQYDPDASTITMHSASGAAPDSRADDPHLGMELIYSRELGKHRDLHWGFEVAFNYLSVGLNGAGALSAGGTITSDAYAIPGGYPPPPAGYPGDYFASAGDPLLYDTPASRSVTALSARVAGTRDFDADVFGWRLGPYLELPVANTVAIHFSAGLSLALVSSDFSFNETLTYLEPGSATDQVTFPIHDSSSHTDFLAGGYASGTASLSLSKHWGAFGGVQFQSLGHYTHSDGASQARLDLSQSVFLILGATCTF